MTICALPSRAMRLPGQELIVLPLPLPLLPLCMVMAENSGNQPSDLKLVNGGFEAPADVEVNARTKSGRCASPLGLGPAT